MPRFVRPLLLLLLTGLLLSPGAAQAHDQLIGTDPEDGAVLTETPAALTLTFSGDVADVGAQVAVTGGPGGDHLVGDPVVDGEEVVQELADLQAGTYEVAWRVTSSDGHPISGTLAFSVDQGTSAGEGEGQVEGDPAGDATEDGAEGDGTDAAGEDAGDGAVAAGEGEEADPTVAEGVDTGLPGWVWLVLGLAVLGLGALLAHTWTRNRRG